MATPNNTTKSFTLWPYAIVTCMLLFMGYIAFFVTKAMNQDVDLVSKNYYEQELAYQDHINTVGRTKAMGDAEVTYDADAHTIALQLPAALEGKTINGTIDFFRPSDEHLDFELPLQADQNLRQLVNAGKLQNGLWKVRVNYSAGVETYYTEKSILVK